ncbi:C45 family peptidase [Paenibacillus sp. NEAU-GSW1]|uniref:C45 family autoproteolytic acyltransferase/hydolase n=1 Tax=Paenibacillus sp. NEAU-GSW1 TaxID=2682486 RepID=UPI0012E1126E|nr:C45 family peptidase [Paenibacillus sp. NEAU-GSW1]MUT67446.1 linear amide C-N hydrolase [Paenibacillus sp. NEAU-GSW1]
MTLFLKETMVHASDNGLTVRHIELQGNNHDIGYYIGRMALDRYTLLRQISGDDPIRIRNQHMYLKKNYPEHYERMEGIAEAFGVQLDEGSSDCSGIIYQKQSFGCSAVYFPNHTTATGAVMLSRNFDFPVTVVNEPYIFEVYPDKGYPSLYLCSFDLVSGVLDGINSEGLTVAVLADDESFITCPAEPNGGLHVGLHELQIMRYLLDRCRNVDEAKEALLSLKHSYAHIPLHYIIGDRNGQSFVWENSYTTNRYYMISGENKPQEVTNFLLHRYSSAVNLPDDPSPHGMYQRFISLQNELNRKSHYTDEDMMHILSCAHACLPEAYPHRTLWHNLYNTRDCSMDISFYAAENTQGKNPLRTDYFRFKLK